MKCSNHVLSNSVLAQLEPTPKALAAGPIILWAIKVFAKRNRVLRDRLHPKSDLSRGPSGSSPQTTPIFIPQPTRLGTPTLQWEMRTNSSLPITCSGKNPCVVILLSSFPFWPVLHLDGTWVNLCRSQSLSLTSHSSSFPDLVPEHPRSSPAPASEVLCLTLKLK